MAIWKAKKTLLIVGEGRHEEAFLNHVRQLYAPRGCGLAVTIKNARGKGAKHVIDWTIRQIANADYDTVAAMLDTDQDWNATVQKQANQKKIQVLASDPCFEAVMLRVQGKNPVGDYHQLKKIFAPYVNNDPTQFKNYEEHFNKAALETGRTRDPAIDNLLKMFDI